MMRRFALILAAVVAVSTSAWAQDKVSVDGPYAFSAAAGAPSAAAFMTVSYPPAAADMASPDRLLRVETPVAERAEIHTMVIEKDVMQMRKVDVLPLPPTGKLIFSPQGMHVMLLGLRGALTVGQTFPMTLVFEKAGSVDVTVAVRAAGDIPQATGMTAEPPEEVEVHKDLGHATQDHGHKH